MNNTTETANTTVADPEAETPTLVWVQPVSRITDHVLCCLKNIEPQSARLAIALRSQVLFSLGDGIDSGKIVATHINNKDSNLTASPAIRIANSNDLLVLRQNDHDRTVAKLIFSKLIDDHNIPAMKPVSVRYTFDRTKIIFSFTAKVRVDFRALAKDLSKVFRSRIEIRQIPVEYEVRQHGTVGSCGRITCCSQHHHLCNNTTPSRFAKGGRLGPCGKTLCCEKW